MCGKSTNENIDCSQEITPCVVLRGIDEEEGDVMDFESQPKLQHLRSYAERFMDVEKAGLRSSSTTTRTCY